MLCCDWYALHGAGQQVALWPYPRPFPSVRNRVWPHETSYVLPHRGWCVLSPSSLLRVELKEICEHQGRIRVSLPCILKLNQLLSNLLQSPFLGVRSVACPCLEMLYCRSEVEGAAIVRLYVNGYVCRQRDKYY